LRNHLKAGGSFSFTIQQKVRFKTKLKSGEIQLNLFEWLVNKDVTDYSVTSRIRC